MNSLLEFLNIKIIKCYNVYINPIIIGAIFSSLGSWDFESDKYIYLKIILVIILSVIYMYTSYIYYKIEENAKSEQEKLKKQNEKANKDNEACNKVLLSMTSLFNNSADSINQIANSFPTRVVQLDHWNYKTVCTGICNGVYETLSLISGYDDFSINIMLYDINSKRKGKNIKMIAHKGKYEGHPKIFEEPLNLTTYKDFYAVKMFKQNSPDISILTTGEDISKNFVFSDNNKEHPHYRQYVGIPIHCSGKQMLSLLQICSFNDSIIAETKDEIMEIINKYILPFAYFALLTNKIEKSFINCISLLEKENLKQ